VGRAAGGHPACGRMLIRPPPSFKKKINKLKIENDVKAGNDLRLITVHRLVLHIFKMYCMAN
jgi:hypothetical protein